MKVYYAFYTAIGNSQNNIKDFYLALFLILSALIVPKWNYIIKGWDNNILYIPNITKIIEKPKKKISNYACLKYQSGSCDLHFV